jgi:hypothetical protein
MGATLTTISPILKEVYEPRIREQLNTEIVALKRIERSKTGVTNEVGGKYVTFPVHTRRNAGIGSRNEGEALPTPGNQGTAAARVGLKYGYGLGDLTGQSISLSDTDRKAFAKAITLEMSGLKDDLRKDINRQVYGTGDGTIGVVKSVVTSNTIPVFDARLFQIGANLDLITGPSTVAAAARTVTAISLASGANTVTISGAAVTTIVGQFFVRQGSVNRELTGFKAITAAANTIYNIDPTVEPVWTGNVDSNGGVNRALSEGLMINMVDTIRTRGGKTTLILQSLGVRRAYFNLLSQQRQVVNTQEFKGGFSGLAFTTDTGEIPVIADPDAPLNTQYYLNEEALTFYRDEEWHFMDSDGSIWQRKIDASGVYDGYFCTMVEYHELGTDQRNSHGTIQDITEG